MNIKTPNFETIRQMWESDSTIKDIASLCRKFDLDPGYMRVRMREEKWPTAGELQKKPRRPVTPKEERDPTIGTEGDMREWLSQRKAQLTKMATEIENVVKDAMKKLAPVDLDDRILRMAKAQRLLRGYFENAERLVDIEGKMSSKGVNGNQTTRNVVMILQQRMAEPEPIPILEISSARLPEIGTGEADPEES